MKKYFKISLAIFALLFLVLSCDDKPYEVKRDCTVTFISNNGTSVKSIVENGKTVEKPENPKLKNATFAGWYLNDKEYDFSSAVTNDITLTAKWSVENLMDISEIKDKFGPNSSMKFGFNTTGFDFDGKDVYIVENWQNVNTSGNLTIKGVTFKQGLSIHTNNPKGTDITIHIEDCSIYACNQDLLIQKGKEEIYKIDNSGDGLCLAIDTASNTIAENEQRGFVSICVIENNLIGTYDKNSERNGYQNWGAVDAKTRNKSRGNGVSLGNQAGNTFNGLKGHALQLYSITSPATVTVKDNNFISWGINKQSLNLKEDGKYEKDDYAIRGDLNGTNPGNVVLSNNTYSSELIYDKDFSNIKVAIDRWNQKDGVYDQSMAK